MDRTPGANKTKAVSQTDSTDAEKSEDRYAVTERPNDFREAQIEELTALYQTSPVGLAFLDKDLRYIRVNEALAEMNGVPIYEMVGHLLREVLPASLADMVEPSYRRVLMTGEAAPQLKVIGKTRARPDEERTWLVSHHPVRDFGGMLLGVQTVVLDVTELQRAERSLVESEQRFRLLIDAIQDYAIYMLDSDGVVATWNASTERMKGYTAAEVIGKHFSLFYRPEDREAGNPERDLAQAKADGRFQGDGWYLRKNGSLFYAHVVITAIYDDKGRHQGFAKVTSDITERKQAEAALRRSEERFSRAFSASPDGLVISREADGMIHEANESFLQLFGLNRQEAIGNNSINLGLFADPEDRARAFKILREEGSVRDFELDIRRRSGETRTVLLSVERIEMEEEPSILTIIRDVTDQKRSEEEVRVLHVEALARSVTLEAANRVALGILASRTGVEALRHIADAARTLAGARYAALGVANLAGEGLQEFITTGLTPQEEAAIGPRPRGLGVLGLLLTRTEPLRIDSLSSHPSSAGFPPNHPPMDSFLGIPIRQGDTILGSLYLTNKEGSDGFTETDEAAVQALAAHAAVAIHHLHLLSRQRALLSGLINAQEEERRAVAYDLHDGLTQYVMASHAHLEVFRSSLPPAGIDTNDTREELEKGITYLKEAVLESRRLVNGLRALALDDLGLAGALEQLLKEEKGRAGWQEAHLVHNIAGRRFDPALETTIYRVAQEALTNTRKHAGATRVRISLLSTEDQEMKTQRLTLEIRDWGQGFVPNDRRGAESPHGFGLNGMIERIHLAGGNHALQSAPNEGTRIQASFPIIEPS